MVHPGGKIRHAFAGEDFGERGVGADIFGRVGSAGLVFVVVGASFAFFVGCGGGGGAAVVEAAGRFVACGGVVHEAGEGSWGVIVFNMVIAFLGGFVLLVVVVGFQGFGYREGLGDGGWWEFMG